MKRCKRLSKQNREKSSNVQKIVVKRSSNKSELYNCREYEGRNSVGIESSTYLKIISHFIIIAKADHMRQQLDAKLKIGVCIINFLLKTFDAVDEDNQGDKMTNDFAKKIAFYVLGIKFSEFAQQFSGIDAISTYGFGIVDVIVGININS
uniref:Uncharacterized protein n=1 Tax=Romanomermis culicivorax TaxID=13658 RepID=A0A915KUY4_ROMCU